MANKKSNKNLQRRMNSLSFKYYNRPYTSLTAFQLDKVIGWALNHSPDKGRNNDNKYKRTVTNGSKYLNSQARTQRIISNTKSKLHANT